MKDSLRVLLFFVAGDGGSPGVIPLGLSYLASYMQDRGPFIFKGICTLPDDKERLYKISPETMNDIKAFNPDVIFMTVSPSNLWNSAYWAEKLKQELPDIFIVWGGFLPSFIPEDILREMPFIDAANMFEGERAALALGNKLLNGCFDFADVPNLCWRRGTDIIKNPIGKAMDLGELNNFSLDLFEVVKTTRHLNFAVSRGCPYTCKTKICGGYWGGHFSTVSPHFLRDFLEKTSSYPDIRLIVFDDYLNRPQVLSLFESVLPEFPFIYRGRSGFEGLTEEIVQRIKKLNFSYLYMYSMPLVPSAQKRRCKEIAVSDYDNAVRLLRKYNISFRFPVHIGTSNETLKELEMTFDIIDNLDLEPTQLEITFGTYIQPGSIDYERLLEKYPKLNWLKEQELDSAYMYMYSSAPGARKKPYTIFNIGTEYNLSDIETLKTVPYKEVTIYSSVFPFDFNQMCMQINYRHIEKELNPKSIIGIGKYNAYISFLDVLKKALSGKQGIIKKMHIFLHYFNEYLNTRKAVFDFVTCDYYFQRTLKGLQFDSLSCFNSLIVLDDGINSNQWAEYIVLHVHPEYSAMHKDLLSQYHGNVIFTTDVFMDANRINMASIANKIMKTT